MGKRQDLLEAARSGNVAVVRKIVEACSKKTGPLSRRSPSINAQDSNGYTPLHHTCLNGHWEIVRLLLSCNEVVTDLTDIRGSTPLYLASWAGHDDIVRLLLRRPLRPANPNAQTIDNETALHCAAQHGHSTVLGSLLSYGADPTIRNNSFQTALDLASQFGRLKSVQILIQTHPELIEPFRSYDETTMTVSGDGHSPPYAITPTQHIFTHSCLHLAARNGHNDVVEALLRAGVDPNTLTNTGTALHEAALSGRKSVVCTLLRSGTDPEAVDGQGRTVLDVLEGHPPHIIYDIVSIIKEFCQHSSEMDNKTHFMPVKDIRSTINSGEYEQFEEELLSHERIPLKENYTPMKSSKELLNLQPSNIECQMTVKLPCKKPIAFKIKPQNETSMNLNNIYYCTDEYVEMIAPDNNNSNHNNENIVGEELTPTASPLPTPRNSINQSEMNEMNIAAKHLDRNNNYSNSVEREHSPTPEFPPPSVTQAENTIFELVKPTNMTGNHDHDRGFYEELRSFIWKNREEPNSESVSSSRLSEYVEEFISDVPFAGLFKGSSLNLAKDPLETSIQSPSSKENSNGNNSPLNSPQLVHSLRSNNREQQQQQQQQQQSVTNLSTMERDIFDFDATKAWEEINNIFETIGTKISIKNDQQFASCLSLNKECIYEEQRQRKEDGEPEENALQIRKPVDLLLSTGSEDEQEAINSKWCHAVNSLIYGHILYNVYYLGSTVIRGLHGVASTRKSIQRLKWDNSKSDCNVEERPSSNTDESGLLNNIKTSTHALKETNQQSRQEVGIALSYVGVRFIDLENKKTICQHDVENINCVCQDPDDLRYFAYMTREGETYYCHVFMVDDLNLAKEIILTLGQAFEIAYQLALANSDGDKDNVHENRG